MERIYLNNCVTSMPDEQVIQAMLPYMRDKFYFPENFISTGTNAQKEIATFKQTVAATLNANPDELHFTNGGTSANNIAIKGYLLQNSGKGTHIICSVVDYPDILTNAAFFESSGFEVTYLPADTDGFIDYDALKSALRPDTVLVMTTLANHTTGTVQDIAKIRKLIDESPSEAALLVDAGQAYGRMPIDVNNPKVDLLSVSAHKIHGPQGIGALYVRKGIQLAQYKHGIARIDQLETGGISIALMAGFAKAAQLAFADLDASVAYLTDLRNYLLQQIEEKIPHILVNGPRTQGRISHNLNVSFDFIEGEAIMMMMDMHGVTVATGSACASQGLKPNYILMAIGRTHVQSHGSVKFTLSRFNTRQQIDYTVEKLAQVVSTLRQRSPLYQEFLTTGA